MMTGHSARPSSVRARACWWLTLTASVALCAAAPAQNLVTLADFEDGIGPWKVEADRIDAVGSEPAGLARIVPAERTHALGGRSAGAFTFATASRATARIALPVDGAALAAAGAHTLSFWLRPYGPAASVQMVLSGVEPNGVEHRYVATLNLSEVPWTQVMAPLTKFTEDKQPIGAGLKWVSSFCFYKHGDWQGFTFLMDDLRMDCARPLAPSAVQPPAQPPGPDAPQPPDVPPPAPAGPDVPSQVTPATAEPVLPEPSAPYDATVNVRFDKPLQMGWRPALGASVGLADAAALQDARVARRLQAAGLKLLRIRVPVPAGGVLPAQDLAALDAIVGTRPKLGNPTLMVCLDDPYRSKGSADLVAVATAVAKRFSGDADRRIVYWEVFNEPALLAASDATAATQAAKDVALALSAIDAGARVGGLGLGVAERSQMAAIVKAGEALPFYSWHLYGSRGLTCSPEQLMAAARVARQDGAPDVLDPGQVDKLLTSLPNWKEKLLFITECAANGLREEVTGAARDPRLVSRLHAAWFASAMVSFAPFVDAVFLSDAVGASWGVLDAEGNPYPAYWAAYLVSRYMPRGATICEADTTQNQPLRAFCVSGKQKAVLLVNQANAEARLSLRASGVSSQSAARVLSVGDKAGMELAESAVSPQYSAMAKDGAAPPGGGKLYAAKLDGLTLAPFGVAIVLLDAPAA